MTFSLNDLKSEYKRFKEKYNLPEFKDINEIFEIERIERESEILPKIIRKIMIDKVINVVGFLEMFMNPVHVPRMYHGFFKSMNESDKQNIDELYKEFAELLLLSMESDSEYNEQKEADSIKKIFIVWRNNCEKLNKLARKMKEPSETNKRERNYFG